MVYQEAGEIIGLLDRIDAGWYKPKMDESWFRRNIDGFIMVFFTVLFVVVIVIFALRVV